MKQKCILVITDGIGYNKNNYYNAFYHAKKPNYERLFKQTLNTLIKTSGEAVGLPSGQMGNSEVGHMCIGSGRIIYQDLVRINKAIKEDKLKDNIRLKEFLNKVKKVHIIGLYSDGGVHSHINHFKNIAKICKNNKKEVYAHAISDGRDTGPKSGIDYLKDLKEFCEEYNINLVSIAGRFYAMDRDKRYDRIKSYYETLLNKENNKISDFLTYINNSYEKNITDEFIIPATKDDFSGIKEEDGIIFINFRNDRMKEIVSAFCIKDFKEFKRDFVIKNALTMTNYDDKFDIPIIFEKEKINNTLAECISKAGYTQLHTAETEKYAHVSFFLNGGKEEAFINEERILIPSPKVKTYDERPQMSAYEVLDAVKNGIKDQKDFIVVNFANGDMVGHTGDFKAAIKAVEVVDECLGELIDEARKNDYAFIITSDHGNCEEMKDENGNTLTNHTNFDVFIFVEAKIAKIIKNNMGLSNIAATVLKIMDIKKPQAMNEAII